MKKEDCYFLGTITRKHGLQGHVILKLDTDQPELYEKLDRIFIEINGLLVPFFIQKCSWSKLNSLNILIKNINPQSEEQILGKDVYLPLSTLPKLTGNQFYYHEVKGFRIIDSEGVFCGIIESVNDQTPQHNFILKLGEKQIIIPIIQKWILEVNREEKRITMELPEGLLDVFLVDTKRQK